MSELVKYRVSGRQPRKRVQNRRIASFTELGEWTGRDRWWVAKKAKQYILLGNNLNLKDLFDVLDFANFLLTEIEKS